jgi:hypothetical protein
MLAVIGLTLAIVIVATNSGTNGSSASPAAAARPATQLGDAQLSTAFENLPFYDRNITPTSTSVVSTPYYPAQLDTGLNGTAP